MNAQPLYVLTFTDRSPSMLYTDTEIETLIHDLTHDGYYFFDFRDCKGYLHLPEEMVLVASKRLPIGGYSPERGYPNIERLHATSSPGNKLALLIEFRSNDLGHQVLYAESKKTP